MSLPKMFSMAREQLKILYSIIQPIPVLMVNALGSLELATQRFLHHVSVLKHLTPSATVPDEHSGVALRTNASTRYFPMRSGQAVQPLKATVIRTKPAMALINLRCPSLESVATHLAGPINPRISSSPAPYGRTCSTTSRIPTRNMVHDHKLLRARHTMLDYLVTAPGRPWCSIYHSLVPQLHKHIILQMQ